MFDCSVFSRIRIIDDFQLLLPTVNKPGECPPLANNTRCDRECYTDADCRDGNKCCDAGCSQVCVPPYVSDALTTTYAPPQPHTYPQYSEPFAPVLEQRTDEEVNVIQPEGQKATLRCFATGYPLPTVTWKKGSVVVCVI